MQVTQYFPYSGSDRTTRATEKVARLPAKAPFLHFPALHPADTQLQPGCHSKPLFLSPESLLLLAASSEAEEKAPRGGGKTTEEQKGW